MYEKADMHDEHGAWQMIFGLNTIPACRKKGYAGIVLRRAIHDAEKEGRRGLVLTCKKELIHYYGKFGFLTKEYLYRFTAMWCGTRCALLFKG